MYDIVRGKAWPKEYTGRLMHNDFIHRWHGNEEALRPLRESELRAVESAHETGDYDCANVTVGQAIGLIGDVPSAADVVHRTARQARDIIDNAQRRI